MEDLATDHLTEDQLNEVIHILDQASPLDPHRPLTTFAEQAFYNEEIYREARENLEREANNARLIRLTELGCLIDPEDQIYDWEEVDHFEEL